MQGLVEYLWLDGAKPTQAIRSKARIVDLPDDTNIPDLDSIPEWSFDGSSTNQATGDNSDLILKPVYITNDPIRGMGNYLCMCEVLNADGTPHETNHRAELRRVMDAGARDLDCWWGFEQEYTLLEGRSPVGWPERGYPAPQGPFYCGVGSEEAFGRDFVETHTEACMEAGLLIYGINAEVMPGQWEFQLGYRGFDNDPVPDALTVADQLWIARWLLFRVGEEFQFYPTLHPKPVKGDWNGAGKHTNFSTNEMRNAETGKAAIAQAIERLESKHDEHIGEYGYALEERLTGKHETAHISEFLSGVSNRGASIRIPIATARKGYGYLEDRRPGANADPYRVACRILKTIADIE